MVGSFFHAACTAKEAAQACDYHLRHGTTTIFPTVTSMSVEKTERALSVLSELIDRRLSRAVVAGVHLEGPYFSAAQCGAQNAERITPPIKEDYERILAQYGKIIKRWSYAPERDRDEAFCRALVQNGVLPSMGHSDARYEDCVLFLLLIEKRSRSFFYCACRTFPHALKFGHPSLHE